MTALPYNERKVDATNSATYGLVEVSHTKQCNMHVIVRAERIVKQFADRKSCASLITYLQYTTIIIISQSRSTIIIHINATVANPTISNGKLIGIGMIFANCGGRRDEHGFRREHDADDRDVRRRRKWDDDEDDAGTNRALIRAEAVRADDRADERVARTLQDADDMADVRAARRFREAGVEANRAQPLARPLPLLLEDRHADRVRRREAARVAETLARQRQQEYEQDPV
jgi:hypothetical protein